MKVEAIALNAIRSTDTRTFNGGGCTLAWAWERVDDRYGVPRTPRSYFERGTLGHSMIETWLNGGDPISVFDAYVPPEGDWLETMKCTKANLMEEVAIVYDKWENQYQTLEEYENITEVATEVKLETTTPNGTVVSTEADAIFTYDNGSIALVDWKLGTSKSGLAMQLYVYWYVMRMTGVVDKRDPFRAWFHYATYSKPIVHITDYPGDTFVEAYIDNADKNRREGPYLPNPEWFRCSQCEYKPKCPLWGGDWAETRDIEVSFV